MGFNEIPQASRPIILGSVKDEHFRIGDATQRHPIGTIYRPDERSFIYAMAGGTWLVGLGCGPADYQHIGYCEVAEDLAIGEKLIQIDVEASMGVDRAGLIEKDELFNGTLLVHDATTNHPYSRRILSNTAIDGAEEMTLLLDHGFEIALEKNTDHAEAIASRCLDVRTGINKGGCVGFPVARATDGQFGWLQTWGPCAVTTAAGVGGGTNDKMIVLALDGAGRVHDVATDTKYAQHIGYSLANLSAGTQGAPFVFLQISY